MQNLGPVLMISTGTGLIAVNVAARRRPGRTCQTASGEQRKRRSGSRVARLVWDLTTAVVKIAVFAAFMLAPRSVHVQRIPRPRARRMVQALNADKARKLTR